MVVTNAKALQFWTEDMSRDFIRNEYPWFIKTYESFRYPIQREQTVRYFILRHYGGIYIDLDFVRQRSYSPITCVSSYRIFM